MVVWFIIFGLWLFMHRPFEIWAFLAAFRVARLYMVLLIAAWLYSLLSNPNSGRSSGNLFTVAICLYTLAATASALFSPYIDVASNIQYQDWLKYLVFYAMLVTCVKTERDLKIVLIGLVVSFFLFMAHSYWEFLHGRVILAAGVPRLVGVGITFSEFNDYGTMIVCMLPLMFPLFVLCKKPWHYLFILGYTLLALRSVLLTGSRTAFVMLAILTVLPILFSRYRFRLLPFILLAAVVGWFAMPEHMQDRYRTIWDSNVSEWANVNREARVMHFYEGMDNWASSPIFGVGPGAHGHATGLGLQAHNLYGQVAGETGTLGIMAFLFMLSCFGINHYRIWKHYKYLRENNLDKEGRFCWQLSLAVMFGVIMILLQGLGLHNAFRFPWVWFGALQVLAVMVMQEKVSAATQRTHASRMNDPSLPDSNRHA